MTFEIWAAEENRLRTYLEKKSEFKFEGKVEEMQSFFNLRIKNDDPDRPPDMLKIKGETASIDISGVMVNELDLFDRIFGGAISYSEILRSIQIIHENAGIKNVDLLINSPGGEFQGIDNVFKALMGLRETRELTAVNRGLMASGAYYLAVAAQRILSTSETNLTGSIGVVIAGLDFTEMMKKDGVKQVVILSQNAPDKFADISTSEGVKLLQKRVNTSETFFLDRISKGRGLELDFIKKNFGRGDVLIAQSLDDSPDALSVGMIDGIINNQETGSGDPPVSLTQKQEKIIMTLSEMLAANPELKVELDTQLAAEHQKGLTAGTAAGEKIIQDRVNQAMTYLKEDGPYLKSKAIMNVVKKVMAGTTPIETLEMCIEVFDTQQEGIKSDDAQKQTENLPATPGQQSNASTDGIVRNAEDAVAGIDKIKSFV